LQKQSLDLEGELREQLSKMQGSHAEEAYSLRQAVKRLEMEVSCLNRKWSVDFDRMLKEKELESRSLREKYTGLLRAKRQVSRQSSIVTQNPSSSSASQCSFLQGDHY
jgi:septal ring factor EnvC (AmiA/AmiB activator)